jgi:hypothetical protein
VPEDFIQEKILTKGNMLHVPVSIQLVLVRDMTSKELAQVFNNVLLEQIHKAQGGSKTGSGNIALQKLAKLFADDQEKWEKGSTLQISRCF